MNLAIVEEVIARRLAVIQIETTNLDDVNAIFESLNAKGKDLTQLDLVRNYVFMQLGPKAADVINSEWLPMLDSLGFGGIEALAWAELVARGRYTLQKRLYHTTQLDLQSRPGSREDVAFEYVRQLRAKSYWWKAIVDPTYEPDPDIRRALSLLKRGGGTTTGPFALYLMDIYKRDGCTKADLVTCLRLLLSFVLRRLVCGMPPNNLNSMFGSMLTKLHDPDSPFYATGDVVNDVTAVLQSKPEEWPTDDRVRSDAIYQPFYTTGKTSQRVVVFEVIDRHLDRYVALNYEDSDKSLEHILPQDATSSAWSELTAEERFTMEDALIHSLGNLAIVSPGDNSRLGVKPFADKREIFDDISYPSTRRLADVQAPRGWTPTETMTRADDLATTLCAALPRPVVAMTPTASADEFDESDDSELVSFSGAADEAEGDVVVGIDTVVE